MVVCQLRGIQPDRWLQKLAPHTDLLFSATAVRFWLVAAVLTLCGSLLEFHRFYDLEWTWGELLNPARSGMLLAVFLLTRGLHELGHALVCKRFGVRCPDIGVLLILGAPCVYCDVSESWVLKSRWQRAAVAAAGMYVEVIIATLAAWVWLATIDGPVNTLALQTMFVCSVSTLLINANPLMRFDGYYILADWLDEANLRKKADGLAMSAVTSLILGSRGPKPVPQGGGNDASQQEARTAQGETAPDAGDHREVVENEQASRSQVQRSVVSDKQTQLGLTGLDAAGNRHWYLLVAFSLAGWIYRAALSVTIATLLVALYANWNLVWVGRLIAGAVLISWWGVPAVKLFFNLFSNSHGPGARLRLGAVTTVAVVLVGMLPLPHRRFASGWIQPVKMQNVYAQSSARLLQCDVVDGQVVSEGQSLFQLDQTDLLLEAVEREGAVERAISKQHNLRQLRDMHGEDIDLREVETDVETARKLAANTLEDLRELSLRAAIDGKFCATQSITSSDESNGSHGTSWCDSSQLGRIVPEGTRLGSICGTQLLAIIPLAESQLRDIASGSAVRVRVSQLDYSIIHAQVDSVVQFDQVENMWQQPDHVADSAGQMDKRKFAAVVRLPDECQALPGSKIEAVFVTPSATLASTGLSWLRSNLRLLAD